MSTNFKIYTLFAFLPILLGGVIFIFGNHDPSLNNLTVYLISVSWTGFINSLMDIGISRLFISKIANRQSPFFPLFAYKIAQFHFIATIILVLVTPLLILKSGLISTDDFIEFFIIFGTLAICLNRKTSELFFQSKRTPVSYLPFSLLNTTLDGALILHILFENSSILILLTWSSIRLLNLVNLVRKVIVFRQFFNFKRLIKVITQFYRKSKYYSLISLESLLIKNYDKTFFFIILSIKEPAVYLITNLALQKFFFISNALTNYLFPEILKERGAKKIAVLRSGFREFSLFILFYTLASLTVLFFYQEIARLVSFDLLGFYSFSFLLFGYLLNLFCRPIVAFLMAAHQKLLSIILAFIVPTAIFIDYISFIQWNFYGTFWFFSSVATFISCTVAITYYALKN